MTGPSYFVFDVACAHTEDGERQVLAVLVISMKAVIFMAIT